MFLVTDLVNEGDRKQLLTKIDKQGTFPTMVSTQTFQKNDEGFLALYRTVVIDIPNGYFEECFGTRS